MNNYTWTENDIKALKEHYHKKDWYDILKNILPPELDKRKIKRKAGKLGLKNRIFYTKDDKFFDSPNAVNSYIVGWLASDGCVSIPKTREPIFCITQNQRDAKILDYVKEQVKYTGPVLVAKSKNTVFNKTQQKFYTAKELQCILNIGDAGRWVDNLNKIWNITPAKSLTLLPPNITEKEHIIAYIQGYVSGDGTITLFKKTSSLGLSCIINAIGTYEVLSWMKENIERLSGFKTNVNVTKTNKTSNIYTFCFSEANSCYLIREIDKLPTHKMERKFDKIRFFADLVDEVKLLGEDVNKKEYALNKFNNFCAQYELKHGRKVNPRQDDFWKDKFTININENSSFSDIQNYFNEYAEINISHARDNGQKESLSIALQGHDEQLDNINKWLQVNLKFPPRSKVDRMLYKTLNYVGFFACWIYDIIKSDHPKWNKNSKFAEILNNHKQNNPDFWLSPHLFGHLKDMRQVKGFKKNNPHLFQDSTSQSLAVV